jgi:hypothetical protein
LEHKRQQDAKKSEQRDDRAHTRSAHEAPFIDEVRLGGQILAGKFRDDHLLMLAEEAG